MNYYQKLVEFGIIDSGVDVGWTVYKVKLVDFIQNDPEETRVYGNTDSDSHEITLIKGLDDNQIKETFIHELIHVIFANVGMDTDKCLLDEERRCMLITRGLLTIMNLNPKLKELL